MENCPICGKTALKEDKGPVETIEYFDCRRCGNYEITGMAKATIGNKIKGQEYIISGYIRNQNSKGVRPKITDAKIDEILKLEHPETVIEKVNNLLLFLGKKTKEFGERIPINPEEDYSMIFAKSPQEFANILTAMNELKYTDPASNNRTSLTLDGFKRLYELQNIFVSSKHCFVAIDFDNLFNSVYSEAILPALQATGFEPIYLKDKPHNNLIDDEIISGIKRSRFIITEFSSGNQNVYFEAGLAWGLKREVIKICNKNLKKKLKFDIQHYNIIFYENNVELKNRLINHIQATIL